MRPIEIKFNEELDAADGMMIMGIADVVDNSKNKLLTAEARLSSGSLQQMIGSGSGPPVGSGSGPPVDSGCDKAVDCASFLGQGASNAVMPGAMGIAADEGAAYGQPVGKSGRDHGCCVRCTATTERCWNWMLDGLFREHARTFGEEFVVRRKLMYIQVHWADLSTAPRPCLSTHSRSHTHIHIHHGMKSKELKT